MGKERTEIRSLQRTHRPNMSGREAMSPSLQRIAMSGIMYLIAEASISEEPGAGILHARICAGDGG